MMPNWCDNTLTITGPEDQIREFRDRARNLHPGEITDLCFNKIIRRPPEEDDNWYNWNRENWGVKWDVTAHLEIYGDRHIEYQFDSAWSPPIKFCEKASELFPDLTFKIWFEETGCWFSGEKYYKNGECVYEEDLTHELEERYPEEEYEKEPVDLLGDDDVKKKVDLLNITWKEVTTVKGV